MVTLIWQMLERNKNLYNELQMQHSCDMPLNKLWHDYNESLVERSSVLLMCFSFKSSNKEITTAIIIKYPIPLNFDTAPVISNQT